MRNFTLTGVFVLLTAGLLEAQMLPNSSQSFQLAPAFNPAFTGVEPFTSIKLGYRSQWASFPGAPQFLNVVATHRVNQPADVMHNALRAGAPITTDEIPRVKRIVHGVGANLMHVSNGAQGIIENMEAGLSYALHYPLNKGYFLAMGVGVNYGTMRIRWDKIVLKDPDQFVDDRRGSNYRNINVRTGLMLYSPRFYVHAGYLQVYSDTQTGELTSVGYRYKATAGAGIRFALSPLVELRPGVMAVMDEFDNIDMDYSLKMYYEDRAWGGLAYRDNGFAAIILGFEFNALVGVSYSYEISTGGLQGFNSGSNEIVVGLKLANYKKLNPYTW